MYLYESHLGGFYFDNRLLDSDMCYCEQCGDCDDVIGNYNKVKDIFKDMGWRFHGDKNPNDGGYSVKEWLEFFNSKLNDNLSLDEANEIVIESHRERYEDLLEE